MRSLLCILTVLTIVSPLCAQGIPLLWEDFESGTPTNPVVDGVSGWESPKNSILYTDEIVIDSGQCAREGAWNWPYTHKAFTYTPDTGDVYTLTGTLYAPDSTYPPNGEGSYAYLAIDGNDPNEPSISGTGLGAISMHIGAGVIWCDSPGGNITVTPQPSAPTDVRMDVSADSVDFYYRTNGVTAWTSAGSKAGVTLSDYDQVTMCLLGGGRDYVTGSWIDSILLTIPAMPGDANTDGVVDELDVAVLASNWLAASADWSMGDFNGDETVDDIDATILATNLPAVVNAVPEPTSTAALLALGLAALIMYRRKR